MKKVNLQFFAEPTDTPEDTPKSEDKKPESKLEFTPEQQAEIDRILSERIARERKKLDKYSDYDDVKTKLSEYEKAEEERKKAQMSLEERLQAEKDEAERKAKEAEDKANETLSKANQRLIKSEFRLLAKELGVKAEALDDAFILSDLSAVQVDEEGNVTGVKDALEALKQSKTYLFGGKDYADPASTGNRETKRDTTESDKVRLQKAAEKARRTGRLEDRMAYSQLKSELGL